MYQALCQKGEYTFICFDWFDGLIIFLIHASKNLSHFFNLVYSFFVQNLCSFLHY
jgi:hypothetical protein